jgi:gamma-glutamyltranspeptidase
LISRNIKGYTVVGAPPPSSGGGVIIGALRFLSGYATPFASLADTLSKHRYVEACRHAFAIRMSLSDPKFAREENADAVNDLISGDYIGSLRNVTMDDDVLRLSQYGGMKWAQLKDTEGKGALIDAQEGDRRRRRTSEVAHSTVTARHRKLRLFNYLEDHGTTSLSVVDKDRNTVVITSSINLEFGSKVYSPTTGLILNNQMDDFATPGRADYFGLHPSESNYISPGKRALSSMSPTMVFCDGSNGDMGDLVLSLGGSGGPKIITACLQTILNFAFIGMPLYDAVSSARIHNQLLYHGAAGSNIESDILPQGPTVELSERTRISLEKRGHKLIPSDFLGAVQAVSVDVETDTLTAVSDVRKQGMPAGY